MINKPLLTSLELLTPLYILTLTSIGNSWLHMTFALQSVINRPLLERQELLKSAIAAPAEEGCLVGRGTMHGRMVKLIPNEPLLDQTICSQICHNMEDIQTALDEATRVQVGLLSCTLCVTAGKAYQLHVGLSICSLVQLLHSCQQFCGLSLESGTDYSQYMLWFLYDLNFHLYCPCFSCSLLCISL